jgi:hypothetical protein
MSSLKAALDMEILKWSMRLGELIIFQREMLGSLAYANREGRTRERILPLIKSPQKLMASPLRGEQIATPLK